jgi:UDP-3-O-[3-hydroxymyristoyl] N-acetylglucosamine deacetylase
MSKVEKVQRRLRGMIRSKPGNNSSESLMAFDWQGQQSTLARSAFVTGIGVHSGETTNLALHPADVETGIIFRRTFANGQSVIIPAVSSAVAHTDLCTAVGANGHSIATIEHIMAAIHASGIDNLIIEIDSSEIPILDGSAEPFMDMIAEAGIVAQDMPRRYIRVRKPVRVQAGASWAEFQPYNGTRFEVEIDFDCAAIGRQSYAGDISTATFRRDLSRARTFGFLRNVERLWATGHALGSSLENSVVIGHDDTIINADGLRYADEFVRHKTLDAIGDLALAGAQFIGCFRSYRGGHSVNARALKTLLSDPTAFEIVEPRRPKSFARGGDMIAVMAPVFAPWVM